MTDPYTLVSTRRTPQTAQAEPNQVENSAGGFTFSIEPLARLRRFLILGTEGGTYYTGSRELTKDNAAIVIALAKSNHQQLVTTILDVSERGAAPKQNPCLFALAIACSVGATDEKRLALDVLPRVARTGTHLFLFTRYVEQFRGWGPALRRAVADWYTGKPVDKLAYQTVKYRQREGWTHRDLLRLSHPKTDEPQRKALFDWVCGRNFEVAPPLLYGFMAAQQPERTKFADLISEYNLSWEMLPDQALNQPEVWEALFAGPGIPQTALMRQLPRLTNLGLLHWQALGKQVAQQLQDPEQLAKARVHPINVLVAQRTYASGHGARGSLTWTPERGIVDALDAAFYASYGSVKPTGKRTMLALDVSGSMTQAVSGMPLSCREASAAMALVTAAVEEDYGIVGFTSVGNRGYWSRDATLTPLSISPRQRLDDAIRAVSNLPFGGTDCSLPMRFALESKLQVDTFVVYTDNETWAGAEHPHQALRRYREKTGIDAKLAVVSMTPTNFSIADPNDPGMLDVAGFDTAVPNLISEFSRGL